MPWLKFTKLWTWSPVKGQTFLYKAGMRELVTTPCFNLAIKAGVAEHIPSPGLPVPEVPNPAPVQTPRRRRRKANGNDNQEPGPLEQKV